MKESIINYLKEHGKSSVNDIAHALNHAGGEKFPQLIKVISAMERKRQLRFNRDGSVSLRPKKEHPNQVTVEGVFHANKNGFGFLHVDDSEDDMFIGRNDVGHAIDGDTVAAVIKKPAVFCCFLESMKYVTANIASLLGCLEPLSGLVLSVLILGVSYGTAESIGIVLILGAVVWLSWAKGR